MSPLFDVDAQPVKAGDIVADCSCVAQIVMLKDNYHDLSEVIVDGIRSTTGFDGVRSLIMHCVKMSVTSVTKST